MKPFILFCAIATLSFTSCSKNSKEGGCGQPLKISRGAFDNARTENYHIDTAVINGDCLEIGYSAGGCNGLTFVTEVFDSGATGYSMPPVRDLKLSLIEQELCEVLIHQTTSVDLRELRSIGDEAVRINLYGYAGDLVYRY